MISVLILTKNEQHDLPGCLASVAWSDDVHVLDSHSTDDTVALAERAGAKVRLRVFDDYATHRNAGLHETAFRHPWVLILDADERIPEPLARELQAVVTGPEAQAISAYSIRRRDFLFGQWLKHAQISPFYLRLVRPERVRYTRAVNEVLEAEGRVATLTEPMDHFPFSKGIGHWVRKHDVYSTMEAELIVQQQGLQNPSWRAALFAKDFHKRRLHQKAIFYRLPGRPVVKWLYMMVGRRAILDGSAGVTYATLQSIYEYLIVLKTKQLRRGGA